MVSVNKEQIPTGTLVYINGSFEESVSLDDLIGTFEGALTVNCKGITRINSVGVKTWINYFQKLKFQGSKFAFVECSPPIVEQLNLISNFRCGGEVHSILLPYSCMRCQKEFVLPCDTKNLDPESLPSAKCERTDCLNAFDDIPEEYFYFLEH